MLTERVRVLAVSKTEIELEAMPATACKGCAVAAGCGRTLLQALRPQRPLRLQSEPLRSSATAHGSVLKTGDIAHIQLEESSLLYLSFLFYLLPLGAVIMVSMLAETLALGEGWTILLATVAFAVSFLFQRQCLRTNTRLSGSMQLTRLAAESQDNRVSKHV